MTSKIIALNDDRIARLKPGPKRLAVYDPVVPGLAIRVQPSGHKSFVYGARYPRGGGFTRRELGQVGKMTLEDARSKAQAWAKLIASGIDPRDDEERLAREKQIVAGNTFAAVAEAYMARRLRGQRRAARVEREIRKELIAVWGPRPITAITRRDVTDLIDKIIDRPTVKRKSSGAYARNIFGHVKLIFDWAINRDYGLGESSPVDRLKPSDLIGKKAVRLRVLNDDELRAIWNASGSLGYPFGPVVRTLMLTGARLSEVTGASWSEFNFPTPGKLPLWTIPAERFKMDAVHIVPMSHDLVALLEDVPRWTRGDYLFTTTEGRKSVSFQTKVKARLDQRANVEGWTLHDIRRTVRTRLSELRIPEPIAEMVIGHAKKGLSRVYNQHQYIDEMREALAAWAARLRSIVDPPPSTVIPFSGRAATK
jgi:integrase